MISGGAAVSVIVPHFSDLVALGRCLDALERQTYPRALTEIVVADNDSPEGRAEVAAVIAGRAALVLATTRGAGPARNKGAEAASGDIFAFIDSDCQAEPDWLTEGVAALSGHDIVRPRASPPRRRSNGSSPSIIGPMWSARGFR